MEDPEGKPRQLSYNDPIVGAASIGIVGAMNVCIGASIRNNNISGEAYIVLVGGSILGAAAGSISFFLPRKPEFPLEIRVRTATVDTALSFAAALLAPLLGIEILDSSSSWTTVIIDELIGTAIIAGGLCCLAVILIPVILCIFANSSAASGPPGANNQYRAHLLRGLFPWISPQIC